MLRNILGIEEIKKMKLEKENILTCSYCNKKYILEEKDYEEIINLHSKA